MAEKVHFYSGPGYRIEGHLYLPDTMKKGEKRACIVLCHGLRGIKEYVMPEVAARLIKSGFIVLAFDYRGFGKSEGPKHRVIPLEQVEDIRNAITFAQTREEVEPDRIGLFGASLGGAHVVYVAATDQRVKCVVSLMGVGDGARWLRSVRREWEWREFLIRLQKNRIRRVLTGESESVPSSEILIPDPRSASAQQESYKKHPERALVKFPLETGEAIVEYAPEKVVQNISPRPILFLSASEDMLVPIVEQKSLYERAGQPKAFVTVQGASHYEMYAPPYLDRVMETSVEWFTKYLSP